MLSLPSNEFFCVEKNGAEEGTPSRVEDGVFLVLKDEIMLELKKAFGSEPHCEQMINWANGSVRENGDMYVQTSSTQYLLLQDLLAQFDAQLPNPSKSENKSWYEKLESLKKSIDPETLQQKIETLESSEFATFVIIHFSPLYEDIQKILDHTAHNPAYGFNNHEFALHIESMLQRALQLTPELLAAGVCDKHDINTALLTIVLHDLGNLLGRHAHSFKAVLIYQSLFGIFDEKDHKNVHSALEAAAWHDEEVSWPKIGRLCSEAVGGHMLSISDEDQSAMFLASVKSTFNFATSLTIFLDKIDIGRERTLNTLTQESQALKNDAHFLANAPWNPPVLELRKQGEETVLSVSWEFNPFPDAKLIQPMSGWVEETNGERKIKLDAVVSADKRLPDHPTGYYSEICNLVLGIYYSRFQLAASHALRLFPNCGRVEFNFNNSVPGTAKATRTFAFDRKQVISDLTSLTSEAKTAQDSVRENGYQARLPEINSVLPTHH